MSSNPDNRRKRIWKVFPELLLTSFNLYSFSFVRIPEALREPLYCQAIREGGDLEWDFLNVFYKGEHWKSLNDIILNALACTTDGFKMRE